MPHARHVELIDEDIARERGRIVTELLKQVLPFDDHDFGLCGPPLIMQALYDGLRDLNVASNRIHAEAFGPTSLTRRTDILPERVAALPVAEMPVAVALPQPG